MTFLLLFKFAFISLPYDDYFREILFASLEEKAILILLHSERSKLHGVSAILSAMELKCVLLIKEKNLLMGSKFCLCKLIPIKEGCKTDIDIVTFRDFT